MNLEIQKDKDFREKEDLKKINDEFKKINIKLSEKI